MIGWIKGFRRGLVEEIFMESAYGKELGSDTLFRWLIAIALSIGFYWCIYHYPYQQAIPAKVAWHRLIALCMSSTGIFVATLDFGISLYRRIKARIAVSKTKNVKTSSEQCPHA